LDDGLTIKRRLKKYDKVVEKIGRLKQQFSKAAKLFTVTKGVEKYTPDGRFHPLGMLNQHFFRLPVVAIARCLLLIGQLLAFLLSLKGQALCFR
jgi:hypothetical protein